MEKQWFVEYKFICKVIGHVGKKSVFHKHIECQGKLILVLKGRNVVEQKQEWQLAALLLYCIN